MFYTNPIYCLDIFTDDKEFDKLEIKLDDADLNTTVIPYFKRQKIDLQKALTANVKETLNLQDNYESIRAKIENKKQDEVLEILKNDSSGWICCPDI